MDTPRAYLLPLWKLLILMMLIVNSRTNGSNEDNCRPIPLSDVRLAAETCLAVRNKERVVQLGDKLGAVNKAGGIFKVAHIIEEQYKGKAVKCVIAKGGNTTIVAFRGTRGFRQLSQAIISGLLGKMAINLKGKSVKVFPFFWKVMNVFLPKIRKYLKDRNQRYIITGHSMGGALASLVGIHMMDEDGIIWNHKDSCLITFGAPRVGNTDYASLHDEMISPSKKLRFVYSHDPVPHYPTRKSFTHHSREVWISKKRINGVKQSFWKVCNELDPNDCSNDNFLNLNKDHHKMWRYKQSVDSPPTIIYDKNSNRRGSFEDALVESCHLKKSPQKSVSLKKKTLKAVFDFVKTIFKG